METNNTDFLSSLRSENSIDEKQQPAFFESFLLDTSKLLSLADILKWLSTGKGPRLDNSPSRISRRPLRRQKKNTRMITHQEWQKMLDHQTNNGGHVTDILVDLGFFNEEDIIQELTTHYGFPYLPLANYEIDKETIKLIPAKIAQEYCLIPIDRINNILMIVMANPLNAHAIDIVETATDNTVQTFVSSGSDIRRAIRKYYPTPEK